MIALVLALSLGASDSLSKVNVGSLSVKLPSSKDWKSTETPDANGKTRSTASTDGDAQIELSVYPVDPKREASVCVEQLLKALGPEGYEAVTVGGSPAYKKLTTDWVGQGEEAKKDEANKVNTISYVGCNGETKWLMSFTSKAAKASRFGVVLKRVVESIAYSSK